MYLGNVVGLEGELFFQPADSSNVIHCKSDAKAQCISLSWLIQSLRTSLSADSLVIVLADYHSKKVFYFRQKKKSFCGRSGHSTRRLSQ